MPQPSLDLPSRWVRISFLAYFAALLPLLTYGLWRLIADNTFSLPTAGSPDELALMRSQADTVAYFAANAKNQLVLQPDELLLAVVLAGALGSYIHGATSYVTFVGNQRFVASWTAWYVLRPFIGVAMALVFYLVVRGGVLVMSGGVSQVDPYAMMTVAALAGMFSKQASDKLAEVFDTLFRARGDAERHDKLDAALEISVLEPASVSVGSVAAVTVRGKGFAADSVVRVDGADRPTIFSSSTVLAFHPAAEDVAVAGERRVQVFSPGPGGGLSRAAVLTVERLPAIAVGKIVGEVPPVAGASDSEADPPAQEAEQE